MPLGQTLVSMSPRWPGGKAPDPRGRALTGLLFPPRGDKEPKTQSTQAPLRPRPLQVTGGEPCKCSGSPASLPAPPVQAGQLPSHLLTGPVLPLRPSQSTFAPDSPPFLKEPCSASTGFPYHATPTGAWVTPFLSSIRVVARFPEIGVHCLSPGLDGALWTPGSVSSLPPHPALPALGPWVLLEGHTLGT